MNKIISIFRSSIAYEIIFIFRSSIASGFLIVVDCIILTFFVLVSTTREKLILAALFLFLISITILSIVDIVNKFVSLHQDKQRTRKLKAIAIAMGLDFYQKGDDQILAIVEGMQTFEGIMSPRKNLWSDFNVIYRILAKIFLLAKMLKIFGIKIPFEPGEQELKNIFKGKKQGCFFIILDLCNINNSNNTTDADDDVSVTKSSQSVIVFVSENLHLPEFNLTKTNNIGKLWGDSQSQSQFSKLYNLQAREQIYHQQIFSERIRAFYEAEQNLCTEAKGDRLICYRANTIIQPQEMQSFLETGFRALELFKEKTQEIASAYTTPSASRDDSNDLSSARRINYTNLQDLLQAGKWKEADQETTAIMLYILSIEEDGNAIQGALDTESMTKFPCTDLHTIDQLWMKYSQGRFGFSVQKEIWQNLGGQLDGQPDKYHWHWKETIAFNRITWQFMGHVGWSKFCLLRKYDKLIFTLDAPPGHLPVLWSQLTIGGDAAPLNRWKLLSRMETCAKQFSS